MRAPATSGATTRLEGFADFVGATIGVWKVPGAAVAVVKDGAVIFCQGFVLLDVGRRLEVTPHTLFPIASCTKAFTTMGLAILVDEGKLDWDVPVHTSGALRSLAVPRAVQGPARGVPVQQPDVHGSRSRERVRERTELGRVHPRADPRAPGNGQHSVLGCRGAADRGLCAPAQGGAGRSGQGNRLLRRARRHRT